MDYEYNSIEELNSEDKEEIRRAEVLQYWRDLSITRITFYSERAVGSLSLAELESCSPWLQNVERLWPKADLEIKSHYWALQEALAQARAKQQTAQSEVQPESSESDLRGRFACSTKVRKCSGSAGRRAFPPASKKGRVTEPWERAARSWLCASEAIESR